MGVALENAISGIRLFYFVDALCKEPSEIDGLETITNQNIGVCGSTIGIGSIKLGLRKLNAKLKDNLMCEWRDFCVLLLQMIEQNIKIVINNC